MEFLRKIIRKQEKIKQFLLRIYRFFQKIKFLFLDLYAKKVGLYNGQKFLKKLSLKESDLLLLKKINSGESIMVARYGFNEFKVLLKLGDEERRNEHLNVVAGFFPKDKALIEDFRKLYLESSKRLDVLASWMYRYYFFKKKNFVKNFPNISYLIDFDSLNPLKATWFKALKVKRVLVVHPFEKTILHQYKRRNLLKIIPKFKSLTIVPAVQSIGGGSDQFKTWFEALEYMKKEIYKKRKSFDIALIGCGAYGFPLASYAKSLGKQAIHLGGSLQLLFGIKGKRWEEEGIVFSKGWIYPLDEDTPKGLKKIENLEGKCYW